MEPAYCSCNQLFNCEQAIECLDIQDKDNLEIKAYERLVNYAEHYCMQCCNQLLDMNANNMEVANSGNNYHRFKIQFEEAERNNNNIAKTDHLLCHSCIDLQLKKESNKGNNANPKAKDNLTGRTKNIICKICEEEHKLSLRDWNAMFKVGCCVNSCYII